MRSLLLAVAAAGLLAGAAQAGRDRLDIGFTAVNPDTSTAVVPEPGAAGLFALGAALVAARTRRSR